MQTPDYITLVGGLEVNILPFAEQALLQCPFRNDLTAWELSEFVEKAERGKYIPVDVQDRVAGRNLHWLIGRVVIEVRRVVHWPHRISQINDPAMRMMSPYIELHSFDEGSVCSRARQMLGRWLNPSELVPFPLSDCDNNRCSCSYMTRSRREGPRLHPDWDTW